jgi:subtilisin-like proprotein convertase family protein
MMHMKQFLAGLLVLGLTALPTMAGAMIPPIQVGLGNPFNNSTVNQNPGGEAAAGGGDTCASCMPIGHGVFNGTTCNNGSEADITSCTSNDTVTAWFCYTASCDGTATASTCGSAYNTALSVWEVCGGSELVCLAGVCGQLSAISWAASAGTTYYIRLSGDNHTCGSYTLNVSCEGDGGNGCGDCGVPQATGGCSDQACQDIVCDLIPLCCAGGWNVLCVGAALANCNCASGGCRSDDDCPPGTVCVGGNCFLPPACDIECPAGALDEGEDCGDDNNGGCFPPNQTLFFTDAQCGDTFCGTAWADGLARDSDWYLVSHGGGILSATLTSQFLGTVRIVDVFGDCFSDVVGDIGCSSDCLSIADASADLPAGEYVVFVAPGDCAGTISDGIPCGSGNDYVLSISCEPPGACCLPDNTCVDGVSQSGCEDPPSTGDCGNCGAPTGGPGCSDPACEELVCALVPFCCDVEWNQICANIALANCICDGDIGGLDGVYQGDNTVCTGPTCIPEGGCCQCDGTDQFCTVETAEDCATLGGVYLGDDAACDFDGPKVTYSSDPNLAIPYGDPVGVFDSIVIEESFSVLDLEVQINITHTWLGDLCVKLSKDGGEPQLLMSRIGTDTGGNLCHAFSPFGCSEDNLNVVLDDDAADSIEDQCETDLSGTFRPDPGSLAGFLGSDAMGTWTLNVIDNDGGDVGTFVSWSLIFTPPATDVSPCEEALPDQCIDPGCFAVTSEDLVCHADGTTFTWTVTGTDACTGGESTYVFTAGGGAVGQQICFTALIIGSDGGICCTTTLCVTIPDCSPAALPSDLDGDGIVGMMDFLALLEAWGSCSDCSNCAADFDGDCSVGILDLLILLENWG